MVVIYIYIAFFILQNTYYLETSRQGKAEFVQTKAELIRKLTGEDRVVLETMQYLSNGGELDFNKHYEQLFKWCQNKMAEIGRENRPLK